jgi:tetratricopeptide (TPR) repeat protein
MTGLSALFFLIALYCHVRFRESKQGFLWYILALVVASLALMTKQNAAVIPGALLLFDWLILSQGRRPQFFTRRMLAVVPFFLLSCLFIYMQVGKNDLLLKDAGVAEYWAKAGETSATKKIAPSDPAPPAGELPKARRLDKPPENLQAIYFVTELSVLWLYLKLLILPYGQIFDYGYPLANKLLDFQTITAGSGLLLLLLLAIALAMKRQPLVAFGVFWFFLALAVESTIIPLDAAVEHRLYMPVFGLAVSMVALIRHFAGGRKGLIILCCIVVAYGVATWQRNSVWADPVAFGLDGVVKAPHNQRNHLTLATAYADAGRWADAEKTLRVAIPLRPYYHVPYDNLGSALAQQGRLAESRAFFSMAAILAPSYPNAVYNYGFVSLRLGDVPASLRSLQRLKELGSPLAAKLGAQFMNK